MFGAIILVPASIGRDDGVELINYLDNLVRNVERKQFNFQFVDRYELDSFEEDGKRYYDVPQNGVRQLYKSVTTVIGEHTDKTWLNEWKKRVGEAAVEEVTRRACKRGTAIHDMAEGYFMGEEYWEGHSTFNIIDFNRLVPIINSGVDTIYGCELPLFSHRLRTAGRADLACQWNNINSIVDFKTSQWGKQKEEITDYFIQSACYAMMFEELYRLTIPQIVIIMLADDEPMPLVFVDNTEDWSDVVEEMFL